MSNWYNNFLPTPKTYYNYSPTRFVESSFGFVSDWWSGSKKEENYVTKLRDALTTLRKNANLISNSLAGEAHIKVNYAQNGQCNDFNGNEFKISPDLLLKNDPTNVEVKEGDEYYDAIDALTGQILTGCQIRKNANEKALKEFVASADQPARHIYRTLEECTAFNQIAHDWVGFTPYLESHRKEFHASKEKVEGMLAMPSAQSATAALCWNFLHPDNKIDLGDTKGLEEAFNKHMLKYDSVKPERRFQHAQEAFELVKKLFPGCEEMQMPGGSSDKEDKEDKDDDKEGMPTSDGPPPKGDKRPKRKKGKDKNDGDGNEDLESLMDGTLFGGKIDASESVSNEIKEVNESTDDEITHDNIDKKVNITPNYQIIERSSESCHADYDAFVRSHRNLIKAVEKSFLFRNTETKIENYGLTVGELDEHSLIKIPMGDLEHLYCRKDVISQKDIAVGLLLDQSGSMNGLKIRQAREVVIVLREALRKIAGVQLSIYGYSAQEKGHNSVEMYRYLDKGKDDSAALIHAQARKENLDGFSIRYASERLLECGVSSRILFIVCDGHPLGHGYRGSFANKHTSVCVEEARRKGVQVFAIGIADAFSVSTGTQLYGRDGFVVISDVESSIGILTREIKKFLNQQVMTTNC